MPLQRIQLPDGQPPAALVTQASAAIAAGRCVVLPTETVYGFAVDPRKTAEIGALGALKGRPAEQPFTHHLADAADLKALVPTPGRRVQRLIECYWPGPLTLILPAHDGQSIGLRVPAQAFTQRVIQHYGHDLLLSSVNPSGDPALSDPQAIIDRFGADIDLFFDAGPSPLGLPSTLLRCTSPHFEVLREGTIGAEEVLTEAAQSILFVCTGNTCRSPMARGYAIFEAARQLAVEPAQVLACGLDFVSAGTSSFSGSPASRGSIQAASEIGIDLAGHRSRMLTANLLTRAARIYCLSESHLEAISSLLPEGSNKAQLLDPGQAIPDPFGGETEVYRETRDHIVTAVRTRMGEILGLLEEP